MPNRLAKSTSPYLLQHKDNPVDWHEWGDEPFELATERNVPVLLSVGYAACHWCHVMAHESFEDPETAGVMNELFVNIKVDREERPDVDSIYMESVQAMSGHGGWPMTVWLDHERRPFFAGTYFPSKPRHGIASFGQVMEAISNAWQTRRDEVNDQAQRLVDAISRDLPASAIPTGDALAKSYEAIANQFDSARGGFGGAPKFPQQPVLEFLLRAHTEAWAPQAGHMVVKTLEEMANGGIHDQIGGGFARYSVDAQWLVPHFEKMLYDNAQLARLYLWAGVELGRPDFLEVARKTLDYMVRDLRHPEGGFFSSEDADSEGVEGKFYVWSENEIRALLGEDAASVVEHYGVTEEGNFEGSNILHVRGDEVPADLDRLNATLLEARALRVRPGLDDKVIASWNGLAIRAFAEAGAALGSDEYLQHARQAARFVLTNLRSDQGLMRSWREGRTSVPGFIDDHASMAVGLLALYQATGESNWFDEAMRLISHLDRFESDSGGFFSTSEEQTGLIKRPVDNTDNPLPSGTALAAEALFIAGSLTGETSLLERSEAALASVGVLMGRYPTMVGHHLGVAHSMGHGKELAIVGEDAARFERVFWSRYRPNVVLAVSTVGDDSIPLLEGRHRPGTTLAYVCEGFVCDLPTEDPGVMSNQLV